jgi:hypothetical protein
VLRVGGERTPQSWCTSYTGASSQVIGHARLMRAEKRPNLLRVNAPIEHGETREKKRASAAERPDEVIEEVRPMDTDETALEHGPRMGRRRK